MAVLPLCGCLSNLDRRDGRRCEHDSWSLARTSTTGAWASPDGRTPVALVLLTCAAGAVLFLAVLLVAQAGMCAAHDQSLRYCEGYTDPSTQEVPR